MKLESTYYIEFKRIVHNYENLSSFINAWHVAHPIALLSLVRAVRLSGNQSLLRECSVILSLTREYVELGYSSYSRLIMG